MPVGITELKLFHDKSRYEQDGRGVGSCPWNWLDRRSSLDNDERLSRGPSRKLYERFNPIRSSSQIQLGISPCIWLLERSRVDKLVWFLKKLGNVFNLREANRNSQNWVKGDNEELVPLHSINKLLLERSRFKGIFNCGNTLS